MDGDRIARATARIETAAARIDAAARRSAADLGDHEFEQRYHQLRVQAGEALAELDRLIGSLE